MATSPPTVGTLNLTRLEMRQAGFTPSVRRFGAAAGATPIMSDYWPGRATLVTLGTELLVSWSAAATLRYRRELPPEARCAVGTRARQCVLAEHTAAHRAEILEAYVLDARATCRVRSSTDSWELRAIGRYGLKAVAP